jgi:hypothetical protein
MRSPSNPAFEATCAKSRAGPQLHVMPIQTDLGLPLSVDGFLTKQNRALLRDFSESGLCLVAASPEKLKGMQRFWGWTVESLPGYLPSSACVVKKGGDFTPECWARWDYRGYRKAFASYLSVCYPEFNSILSANVHVDHLEPRFRFPKGDRYFVRLHLIKKNVNAAYGAGFEKNFYRAEREKPLHGAIHMSWLGFCRHTAFSHLEKMSVLLHGKHGHEIRPESLPRSLVNRHRMHMLGYSAFFNLATPGTTQVRPSTLTLKRCAAAINE